MNRIMYFSISISLFLFGCSTDDTPTTENVLTEEMTLIPDAAFETFLVSLGADDEIDGMIPTNNISGITELVMDDLNISDLTGIEDFKNLDNLWVQRNNLSQIDISQNTKLQFLYVGGNNLSSIDVSTLLNLEKLNFENNSISTIDVSSNNALQLLEVENNVLSSLDVSRNIELFTLETSGNPAECIQVNAAQLENLPARWTKGANQNYALNCN